MATKRSRTYLETRWLPALGRRPPVLDVGTRDYTSHYPELLGTETYLSVDLDPAQSPGLVADVTAPDFPARARAHYPAFGAILCNGVISYGVDSPSQVRACMGNLAELLRPDGWLLVGWNEWDIERRVLFEILGACSLRNLEIEGEPVLEPEESPGYEHLRHHYTLWTTSESGRGSGSRGPSSGE